MGRGLQEGRNVGDGAAQPDFGRIGGCHAEKIAEAFVTSSPRRARKLSILLKLTTTAAGAAYEG